ncbi:ABC transporter substrate-binding protein [Candidatus Bathyarchaeota archaeon]|nr:ABC transporter substrate-binding protein [Candidatus Bathyarchaeota archaeon]
MSGKSKAISTSIALIAIVVIALIAGAAGYYTGQAAIPEAYRKGYDEGRQAGLTEGRQRALQEFSPILPIEIKVGCIMSLTGLLGPMGASIVKGVQLAVDEVNSRGGIAGRRIVLIVEDDGTDATKGLEALKKLVEVDGCQVVIGPMASGVLRAMGSYTNEHKVVLISPSATAPYITTEFPDDYVFRTVGSDTLQGKALGELLVKRGTSKVVILVMNNPYGVGIMEESKKVLGTSVIKTIVYDYSKLDFTTELQMVKDLKPDGVLYVGYYEDGKIMLRQALEMGLDNILWVCAEGIYGERMFEDPAAAEFMSRACIGTRPVAPVGLKSYEVFKSKFRAKFGEDPSMYADTAYDATVMAILAIAKAGDYNGTKIREALKDVSQTFMGATGYKLFDENGDQLYQVYEIWDVVKKDGEYKFEAIGYWP